MPSGAEVWLLNKINDLTLRFGLTPLKVDVQFNFMDPDVSGDVPPPMYRLGIVQNIRGDKDQDKVDRISSLLGVDKHGMRDFLNLAEANETIDEALSLAPRARPTSAKSAN